MISTILLEEELINEKLDRILKIDPLLLDTACQIRAVALLHLSRKIANGIELNQSEFENYISKTEILTHYHCIKNEDFKQLKLKDIEHVEKIKDTTTAKIIFFTKIRTEIAKKSIEFLRANTDINYSDGLEKYINDDYFKFSDPFNSNEKFEPNDISNTIKSYLYISSSKIDIPLIPNFISTLSMLNYLKHQQALLLVNLTRKNEYLENTGTAVIAYRYATGGFFVISPDAIKETEPAVYIEMVSVVYKGDDKIIAPCFLETDFYSFVKGFIKLDITKIIMMLSAAHAQCPPTARGHLEELSHDFPSTLPNERLNNSNTTLTDLDLNLESCSREQYLRFYEMAHHYQMSHDKKENPNAPIFIKHISISNYALSLKKLPVSDLNSSEKSRLTSHLSLSLFKSTNSGKIVELELTKNQLSNSSMKNTIETSLSGEI